MTWQASQCACAPVCVCLCGEELTCVCVCVCVCVCATASVCVCVCVYTHLVLSCAGSVYVAAKCRSTLPLPDPSPPSTIGCAPPASNSAHTCCAAADATLGACTHCLCVRGSVYTCHVGFGVVGLARDGGMHLHVSRTCAKHSTTTQNVTLCTYDKRSHGQGHQER